MLKCYIFLKKYQMQNHQLVILNTAKSLSNHKMYFMAAQESFSLRNVFIYSIYQKGPLKIS